ncbi:MULTISPECIES: iron-containing alcohol dehydrogenase [Cetobacterium]|jgi:alcohol dehydrogenase YqhD (iron-dependent ADH family)|uniref:Iron-containing alcohol dehydrogenase n=1 Tax=Candidatus Cetobacterium colombiensis TaxID=3073100 RepID=A0ABU4W8X6_9FUSO|nr:iron-containing alcohol dehydrogenase [Candidatus Cetobacterium colombiensis]MDX8334958.1 iron-containing alcohol dehydrogenase [Candidatus Cetobacterium colombiensis]
MKNFIYDVPTRILFGQGQVSNLGKEVKKHASKVLLLYGKNSIKQSGLYDEVIKYLSEENIDIIELSGVDPNPRIETVRKGADLCRKFNLELVLAVGGGSTIDCAKAIAAQAKYHGDVWKDLYVDKKVNLLTSALPVASILTLAATGSEMNGNTVISNPAENLKLGLGSSILRPVFSILDPTYTFSVNKYQTAAGIVDIMSHLFEQYFSPDKKGYLQARVMEGLLKTVIHYGPIAFENPTDYEARANIMWASSLSLNGLTSVGKESTDWATHAMEHELSAKYDITHGVGLGILTPYWMEYVLDIENVHRFVEYANNVWGIFGEDDFEVARKVIRKTREFFDSLDIPSTLTDINIDSSKFEDMATGATRLGTIGTMKKLNYADVLEILTMSL